MFRGTLPLLQNNLEATPSFNLPVNRRQMRAGIGGTHRVLYGTQGFRAPRRLRTTDLDVANGIRNGMAAVTIVLYANFSTEELQMSKWNLDF